LIARFSDCLYVDPFRDIDQIRKLSKIGAEFWTFVPSHFFVEDGSSKILSTLSRLPRFTSRGKIS